MENLTLFPIEEFTDERLKATMEGNTCRTCVHRKYFFQGSAQDKKISVCEEYQSKTSHSGQLRVKVNQPACILYIHK